MIELTNIKTTDTLRQLRGQINTMQNEIMADQPFVGKVVNPSINFYDNYNGLLGAVTASSISNQLVYALCLPESNGVFIANVWGRVLFSPSTAMRDVYRISIDVPSIKMQTLDANVSTFVSPDHLGLAPEGVGTNTMNLGMAHFSDDDSGLSHLIKSITANGNTCNVDARLSAIRGLALAAGTTYYLWL